MADLNPITETFAADEPWTPQDPNILTRKTRDVFQAFVQEHNDDGTHNDLRIAQCAGIVTVAAGVATLEAGGVGIDTVTWIKTGHVRVKFTTAFKGTDFWFPDVWPTDFAEPVVPVIDADLTDVDTKAKDSDQCDVKFYNPTDGVLTDVDFFFQAFGLVD